MTEDRRIPLWCVTPLNTAEQPAARALVAHLPPLSPRALVLADQNYDDHALHKAIDLRCGGRLLVVPRRADDGRPSTHPVTLRQMGPARRELLRVWRARPRLVHMVHRHRIAAEATFSNLCSYGGGLGPLPAWVRRLPRVRRWVGGKIILYHARLRARARAKAAA